MDHTTLADYIAALILMGLGVIVGATLLLLGSTMALGSRAWIGVIYAGVFSVIAVLALAAGGGPTVAAGLTATNMSIGAIILLGLIVLLTTGALAGRQLVTSFPPDQEQAFQGYERAARSAGSGAWIASFAAAAILTVFLVGVYFGVAPEMRDITKDMNMSNLSKKSMKSETPAPAPTPSPAPAPAPAPSP